MTNDKARASAEGARQSETSLKIGAANFDAVFLEHWQPIYRVLMRLVADHAEAEDLALETFWRLYRRPPANARTDNLGGWLYRVATNLGLNALRAQKRRAQHEIDAGQSQVTQDTTDAFDAIAAEEERQRVRAVLSAMDERQAQLLILRHSGLAYKELAAALGVSANSIGTLLVRAEREFEKRYRQVTDDQ